MKNAPAFTLDPADATPISVAQKTVERHGLEWMAPLFSDGNTKRLITPKAAAKVLDHSLRHVYELIEIGRLETVRSGHDHRIVKRSLLVHLWESWSGKATATAEQVTTFIVLLLAHLPVKALTVIRDACAHLIARKVGAEHALGLKAKPRPGTTMDVPLPFDPHHPQP